VGSLGDTGLSPRRGQAESSIGLDSLVYPLQEAIAVGFDYGGEAAIGGGASRGRLGFSIVAVRFSALARSENVGGCEEFLVTEVLRTAFARWKHFGPDPNRPCPVSFDRACRRRVIG
jgi:hypothetical protein